MRIVRKGELACYKQFLLFSLCLQKLYIISASKCGIVWQRVNSSQNKIFDKSSVKIPADDKIEQGPKNFRILTRPPAIFHLSFS